MFTWVAFWYNGYLEKWLLAHLMPCGLCLFTQAQIFTLTFSPVIAWALPSLFIYYEMAVHGKILKILRCIYMCFCGLVVKASD